MGSNSKEAFDHKSVKCQYLGFAKGNKAFLCYDPANHCVIELCNMKFHEDVTKDHIILSDNDEIDWVEDAGMTGDAGIELNASGEDEYGVNCSTTSPASMIKTL